MKIPTRKFFKAALASAAVMFSSNAEASSSSPAYVEQIIVLRDNVAFVYLTPGAVTFPACASSQRYVFDTSTGAGQALFATVLAAQKAHSKLIVAGDGTCGVWGDSESASLIETYHSNDSGSNPSDINIEADPTPWRLQDYMNGSIYTWFAGSNCTQGLVILPESVSEDIKQRYWSVVMSAKASGKKVGIFYTNNNGTCTITNFYLREG